MCTLHPAPHVEQANKDLGSDEHHNHVLQEVRLLVLDNLQEVLQIVLDQVKLQTPQKSHQAQPHYIMKATRALCTAGPPHSVLVLSDFLEAKITADE